jgi:hypothetical protein
MKKNIISAVVCLGLLFSPVLALAFEVTNEPSPVTLEGIFSGIIWILYVSAAGLATVMALVAGILFITANGDANKIGTARNALIWCVVGLVVAILAFSIVNIVTTYIGAGPQGT